MTASPEKPVSIRRLEKNTSEVIREVENGGSPKLVTRHGKPAAYLVSLGDAAHLGFEPAPAENVDFKP